MMNDSAYISPYQRTCRGPRCISTGFRLSTKRNVRTLSLNSLSVSPIRQRSVTTSGPRGGRLAFQPVATF